MEVLDIEYHTFTKHLTNCIITPDYEYFQLNTEISFIVEANAGYTFNIDPNLFVRGRYITPIKINNEKYQFTFETDDISTTYILTAYASIIDVVSERYGVLQLYKISNTELESLQNERFINTALQSIVDINQYFASMKFLFVNTENTENEHIRIERVVCNTTSKKVLNDFQDYDLGTVLLAGEYNNELDKQYSTIKISLSYLGTIDISPIYANEYIHIIIRVHFISGYSTVFVYHKIDNNEYLIDTLNAKIGFDLPYINTVDGTHHNIDVKQDDYTQLTPPKIIMTVQKKSDSPIYSTQKYSKLGDEQGYFRVDYINIDNTSIPQQHKAEIQQLLQLGCYI